MPSFNAPFALARRAITCDVLRPRDPVPDSGRLRIVAVGQTPPPFGGQALTTQSFVTGEYKDLEIFHVRMAFSKEMADIGRPQARKLLHLVALIARVLWRRFRAGATVLYYPPAGPALVPVLRDVAILLGTRWAFRSTVFHFNAAGLSEIWPQLPRLLRPLFRLAYGRPELAIKTSALNPPDGEFLGALRTVVVPNGIPELQVAGQRRPERSAPPVLLYIGVLSESKGLVVLADAIQRLIEEPELAGEMGQRGREIYLERFTEQRFRALMERVLREVAPDAVRPAPTPRSGADSR